ncbi:MAG: diguanylate phosphodiesterase [Desulfovibrio sp.]|nr:diguanylate phosphodiesterase [Desulfovibrio sp.]MBC18220.1 diguanylate phosphodiesterase [Desulfovibrio sp.]|tara:strand:+ start:1585 stop:2679 length:1095 start_codon:yes stop_codon:yes gene_type:complete
MTAEKLNASLGGCSRCERTPDPLPESGFLYLAPPMIHTTRALIDAFDQMKLAYDEPYDGVFRVRFNESELSRLCSDFLDNVSSLERHDTKALVLGDNESLTIHHLTRMEPLSAIVAKIQGEWLFGMLENDRIYSHFHPIVSADNPHDIFAYECLARASTEEGAVVNPGLMFDIARQTDMMFFLDRACRLAAIEGCVEHNIDTTIFINFTPGTIYKPEHCLQTTIAAIEMANIAPEQIVFEVVESEEVRDIEHLLSILNYYREHGFRVALDDLGAGFSSLNLLTKLQPDFVKLDMELIRDVDNDPYKAVITENLIRMSRRLGVKTIAEGVETVGEWQWALDKGADYIQGFLFAKPSAPPEPVKVP